MRRFEEKLKSSIEHIQDRVTKAPGEAPSAFSSIPTPQHDTFPSEQDIYRYRKLRGVNLGSWFVLERWISPSPFRCAAEPGQSDLDVARGKDAKSILEHHWDSWITEGDWRWIKERGLNSVRIPIGYYHLTALDPSIIQGTDFASHGHVFEGAWGRITKAIEMAHKYGIGVLVDLHAAPGKQNNDSHSGTSIPPTFFSTKKHMEHTIQILRALLTNLLSFTRSHNINNLIGIQLLNEPHPPNDDILKGWYTKTIKELRSIDPTLPIYLGECWRTKEYMHYITSHPNHHALTVLDHHLYRCFSSEDIKTPTSTHCANLSSTSSFFSSMLEPLGRSGSGLIIGEWSGALNPGSLHASWDEEQRKWVKAQLDLFESDSVQGWFWWTFKKEEPGDKGWSLRDSVGGGVFPSFVGVSSKKVTALPAQRKEEEMKWAYQSHVGYWSHQQGNFQFHRFKEGFEKGWDDAFVFLNHGGGSASELGFVRALCMRRTEDHGSSYWEFEHGYVQGASKAREVYASL
ncbi:glycoside hydrolase superfamily [Cyathus striatus]|nr:glycoside hydrolase superfamily [Cyathus striatus]